MIGARNFARLARSANRSFNTKVQTATLATMEAGQRTHQTQA
jgi:hypothetical protein